MRLINDDELKEKQIELLDRLMAYCQKNNISCWIDSGTLLGAVRHKGFIPWDDDIDVGILRKDYDYLIHEFNKNDNNFQIICVDNNQKFPCAFAKLMNMKTVLDEKGFLSHINIDIFPYDDAPDDKATLRKIYDKRDFYTILNILRIQTTVPNGNIFRKIVVYLGRMAVRPFPIGYFAKKLSNNARQYNNMGYRNIGNFTGFKRFICSKDVLEKFVMLEFEGKLYKAPADYDKWLTIIYGDYMKLPPKEQQVNHHIFKAYTND